MYFVLRMEKISFRIPPVFLLAVFLSFVSFLVMPVPGAEKEPRASRVAAPKENETKTSKPNPQKPAPTPKKKAPPKWKKPVDPVAQEIKVLEKEAQALLKEKKYEEARRKYRRARELRPDQVAWTQRIYKSYYQEKDWPMAMETALESLETHPGPVSNGSAYECARQLTRYKKYDDAAILYEALHAALPDNLNYVDQLITCYHKMERYADIIRVGEPGLRTFVEFHSENRDKPVVPRGFITYLARAYLKENLFEEAAVKIESDPLDVAAQPVRDAVLTRFREEGRRWENERKAAAYREFRNQIKAIESEGLALLKEKEYEQARLRFESLIVLQPERDDPYSRIFQCFLGEGDKAGARAVAMEAIELHPNGRSARSIAYDCARRLVKEKDYAQAVALLEALWRLQPSNLSYLDLLFTCYIDRERYDDVIRLGDDALREFEDYYALNPGQKPYTRSFLKSLVRAYIEKDAIDEAIDRTEASIRFAPHEPARWFIQKTFLDEATRFHYDRKEYAKARRVYLRAAELNPGSVEPLRGIYYTYVRESNWTEAQKVAMGAFDLDPSGMASAMLNECVRRLMSKRNYPEAVAPLETLLAAEPENIYALDSLFLCYREAKRNADLIRLGEAGVDGFIRYHVANPGKTSVRRAFLTYLAAAYREEGRIDEAIGRTESLLDDSPSSGSVKMRCSTTWNPTCSSHSSLASSVSKKAPMVPGCWLAVASRS